MTWRGPDPVDGDLMLVAACAGAAAPSSSPAPTFDGGPVTTEEQAISRADSPRASAGRDREARPRHDRPVELVRGHAGLRVGAFIVTVRIGWGDCQAGCIDEHTWVYAVSPDGSATLQSEGGGTVPDRRGRGAGEGLAAPGSS